MGWSQREGQSQWLTSLERKEDGRDKYEAHGPLHACCACWGCAWWVHLKFTLLQHSLEGGFDQGLAHLVGLTTLFSNCRWLLHEDQKAAFYAHCFDPVLWKGPREDLRIHTGQTKEHMASRYTPFIGLITSAPDAEGLWE